MLLDNKNVTYYMAEIMRSRRRNVFLFEIEDGEYLEDVVKKNFGDEASIVKYRVPTNEEYLLFRRGMRS